MPAPQPSASRPIGNTKAAAPVVRNRSSGDARARRDLALTVGEHHNDRVSTLHVSAHFLNYVRRHAQRRVKLVSATERSATIDDANTSWFSADVLKIWSSGDTL